MVQAAEMLQGLRRMIDLGNCVKQTNKQTKNPAYVRCLLTVSDKSLGMVHAAGMLQGLRD